MDFHAFEKKYCEMRQKFAAFPVLDYDSQLNVTRAGLHFETANTHYQLTRSREGWLELQTSVNDTQGPEFSVYKNTLLRDVLLKISEDLRKWRTKERYAGKGIKFYVSPSPLFVFYGNGCRADVDNVYMEVDGTKVQEFCTKIESLAVAFD